MNYIIKIDQNLKNNCKDKLQESYDNLLSKLYPNLKNLDK